MFKKAAASTCIFCSPDIISTCCANTIAYPTLAASHAVRYSPHRRQHHPCLQHHQGGKIQSSSGSDGRCAPRLLQQEPAVRCCIKFSHWSVKQLRCRLPPANATHPLPKTAPLSQMACRIAVTCSRGSDVPISRSSATRLLPSLGTLSACMTTRANHLFFDLANMLTSLLLLLSVSPRLMPGQRPSA